MHHREKEQIPPPAPLPALQRFSSFVLSFFGNLTRIDTILVHHLRVSTRYYLYGPLFVFSMP